MNKFLIILLLLLPVTAHADEDWTISWKKGLRFDRNDGEIGIKLGGRIQEDFAYLMPSDQLQNLVPGGYGFSTEFRRVRITLSGYFAKNVIFKTQYDFASTGKGDTPGFKDVYIGAKNLPYIGTLKVGHIKEPLSLEMMESSNGLTFMERALPYAFVSDRNTGIRANNTALDKHLTWQFGVFVPTNGKGFYSIESDQVHFTGRVTGTPLFENEGARMIHLGLAGTYQYGNNVIEDFKERPESNLAKAYLDTGDFMRDGRSTFGLEAAWVHDSFSLQSEYMGTYLNSTYLQGAYLEASYYLTGEHRVYNRTMGTFTNRVHPKNKKWGAWQIASRVSYINLNGNDIRGGKELNFTAGINWYFRKNLKVAFNYVHGNVNNGDTINIAQMRTQIIF
jgi:phosphate-selective porin OprO/OprP